MVKLNGNFPLLIWHLWGGQPEWQFHIAYWQSSGQELQFHIDYWCLVVKNCNFTLLVTSSGQEWQFHIASDIIVVKNGNFTLLVTSSCHEWQARSWQIYPPMSICQLKWPRSRCGSNFTLMYPDKSNGQNGNFPLLLTSSHQEWQFHIATVMSSGQEWQFHIASDI